MATAEEREYFTFSAVRNPLDIAVTRYVRLKDDVQQLYTDPRKVGVRNSISARLERRIYAWVQRTDADFASFLRRWYLLPYDTWTTLDHKRMNAVLRFETLVADFDAALRQMGITPTRELPVRNATPGRDRDWERHYTARRRRRAVWVFGPYMETLGLCVSRVLGRRAGPVVEPPALPRGACRSAASTGSTSASRTTCERRPGGVLSDAAGRAERSSWRRDRSLGLIGRWRTGSRRARAVADSGCRAPCPACVSAAAEDGRDLRGIHGL